MTRVPLVIVGAGGQGREIHDVVAATDEFEVIGYLDDAPSEVHGALVKARGARILGGLDWLRHAPADVQVLVGIAAPAQRRQVDALARGMGRVSPIVLHPTATVGSHSRCGPGSVLWPGARLTTNVSLGRQVHVNQCVTIGHDSTIGDYVTLNPAAAVSGDCVVEDGALIGAQSCVLQGLTVGRGSIVGAAACVVRNVAAAETVVGVPAR